jgi:PPOX class probable F420-dependent enzyme
MEVRFLALSPTGSVAQVRKHLAMEDLGDLVELPLLAVLATYRRDGGVLLSPVWHEWREGGFDVVTRSRDVKGIHLRRDPRASIVVCEHSPPYRGVELRGNARLVTNGVEDATLRIACRYLGPEVGAAYAERGEDDLLVRLEPGDLRAWDFADDLA